MLTIVIIFFFISRCCSTPDLEIQTEFTYCLKNYHIDQAKQIIKEFKVTIDEKTASDFFLDCIKNKKSDGYNLILNHFSDKISSEVATETLLILIERKKCFEWEELTVVEKLIHKGAKIPENVAIDYLTKFINQKSELWSIVMIRYFDDDMPKDLATKLLLMTLERNQLRIAKTLAFYGAEMPYDLGFSMLITSVKNDRLDLCSILLDCIEHKIPKETASDLLLIFLDKNNSGLVYQIIKHGASISQEVLFKYLILYAEQKEEFLLGSLISNFASDITLEVASELLLIVTKNNIHGRFVDELLPIFVKNNQIKQVQQMLLIDAWPGHRNDDLLTMLIDADDLANVEKVFSRSIVTSNIFPKLFMYLNRHGLKLVDGQIQSDSELVQDEL